MTRRALLACFGVLLPVSVAAQRITVTPHTGVYVGLRRQSEVHHQGQCGFRPEEPCFPPTRTRTRLLPSYLLGLSVASETDGIGFEGSFVAALTRRGWATVADGDSSGTGSVTLGLTTVAAVRGTLTRPLGAERSIVLGVGGSLTGFRMEASGTPLPNRAIPGASLSAKVRFPPKRHTRFEIGFVSSFYSIDAGSGGRLQHDLMLSAGLGLMSGR